MKTNFFLKLLLVTVLITGVYSCGSELGDEAPDTITNLNEMKNDYYVSYEDALSKVDQLFTSLECNPTRATCNRSVLSHQELKLSPQTRSMSDFEAKFHLINFADNQGYALVSADSRTTGIYAYSLTGNLDFDDAYQNTGFHEFIDGALSLYEHEVEDYALDQPIPQPEPFDSIYGDIPSLALVEYNGQYYHYRSTNRRRIGVLNNLISVAWNQDWPYNYYCGDNSTTGFYCGYRNAVGCGPVAAGQIMSYYRYPASYAGDTFTWSAIMSSPQYNEYYNSSETLSTGANATALLLHRIGYTAHANYGNSTSTTISNIAEMFEDFGYRINGPRDFSSSLVVSSLEDLRPVYVRGSDSNGNGHAWVIDGYYRYRYHVTYYEKDPPYHVYIDSDVDSPTLYYHCNWGWGDNSSENGWYVDTFYGYNSNNRIIYNIRPR